MARTETPTSGPAPPPGNPEAGDEQEAAAANGGRCQYLVVAVEDAGGTLRLIDLRFASSRDQAIQRVTVELVEAGKTPPERIGALPASALLVREIQVEVPPPKVTLS